MVPWLIGFNFFHTFSYIWGSSVMECCEKNNRPYSSNKKWLLSKLQSSKTVVNVNANNWKLHFSIQSIGFIASVLKNLIISKTDQINCICSLPLLIWVVTECGLCTSARWWKFYNLVIFWGIDGSNLPFYNIYWNINFTSNVWVRFDCRVLRVSFWEKLSPTLDFWSSKM